VTILEQAERACVSLAARDRAWVAIGSSRRVATPVTDQTIGGSRVDREPARDRR
jgi:hypothetical protein